MSRFEEGAPDSEICLVGEAPSFQEVRSEKVFVGPSGDLLNLCLQTAQIPRAKCYIVNVFEDMVRKRKDKPDIYASDGTVLWTPTKGFTEAGRNASANTLMRLEACEANVILPMGGPALSLCCDNRRVGKWRGSLIAAGPQLNGRKLIPTLHPASCLHGSYASRFLIISDLRKAKRESAFPEIRPLTRKLIIDPGFDECIRFLKLCRDARAVNTDIELLGGQVDCFSLAVTPEEAISIPLLDTDFESRWSDTEELEIWRLYAEIIGDPAITKVNQNITFDLATLLWLNKIVPRGPISDPMVAHSCLYPFLEKKLGVLCSLYTDEPYYKDDGELQDSPTVADFQKRWTYNAKDSTVSLESWEALEPLIDPGGYRATYEMTMDMVGSLIYMMVHGVALDEASLWAERVKVNALIADKVKQLETAMGRAIVTEAPKKAAEKRAFLASGAINVNSPKQVADYFYVGKGLRVYKNQAGAPTVDDLALARIFRRDGLPEAKLLQEYRGLDKLSSTYLEVQYDIDRRVRCSYNVRGTWTGRLSSRQTVFGTGLQMQNLSDGFMSFLVSDSRASA